jgi:hypothetical protein
MNCNDLKQHLMPFADGELEPTLAAEVEKALDNCPECREELAEMRRISSMSRAAFLAPVEAVSLAGVYDGVMARLQKEARREAAVAEPQPGPWARFTTWCSEVVRFERPMVLAGAAALALAAVLGLSLSGGAESTLPGITSNPSLADGGAERPSPAPELKRRGAEEEVKPLGKNTAYVENISADRGMAYVEFDKEDPEAPMVLWHVVDEEGAPATKGL